MTNFTANLHDSKTLSPALADVAEYTGRYYPRVLVDKGYRGHAPLPIGEVIMPGKRSHASAYARVRHKKLCKRRSAVEAVISHLKSDHRLGRNYLQGTLGDISSALLAGMGFHLLLLLRG